MPILYNQRMVGFHEPLSGMSNADLREYANALKPFVHTNPITVERKIRDIESELEWRRVAHSQKSA